MEGVGNTRRLEHELLLRPSAAGEVPRNHEMPGTTETSAGDERGFKPGHDTQDSSWRPLGAVKKEQCYISGGKRRQTIHAVVLV